MQATLGPPETLAQRSVSRGVQLAFVAAAITSLLGAVLLYRNIRQLYDNAGLVAQAHEIQDALGDILSTMKDVEIGERGYVITGEKAFLQPYDDATREIPAQIKRLETLIVADPSKRDDLAQLEKRIAAVLALSKENNRLREQKGFEAAQQAALAGNGKREMDAIRVLVGTLTAAEGTLLATHERQRESSFGVAVAADVVAVFLALGFLSAAFVLVRRELVARRLTAESLHVQREWLRVTLTSIGDGVIVTDANGMITFLNPAAGAWTGWEQEAVGGPLAKVFNIIDEATRQPSENPVDKVLRCGAAVGLANHTLLIARDGTEHSIDDSAAPIRDQQGNIDGVVLVFRDITSRKHAENALRQSEQELADFFENATVGLHWVGPDGIILRVNAAELKLLGYAREQFVGRSIVEFHADQHVIADILRRLKAGEIINDYGARLRCQDGSIKHVLINSSALFVEGKFIHTRCFTRDITDRKQAEEALRTSEARYRRLFETARDAILLLDGESGKIIEANPFMTDMMGYSCTELTGKELWQIGLFRDPHANDAALKQLRDQGLIRFDRLALQTKAGLRAEGECVGILYEMGNKKLIHFNIHDITARVLAEDALRAARDRFRSVVDHVLPGIITIDEAGLVESVNPAAERLFGYKAAEIVGENVKQLMPESYHKEYDAQLALYLSTGKAKIIGNGREVLGVRKDGSTFPMELAVSTFPLGKRRLFTAIVLDITERKRMETELRQRVAELAEADRQKNKFLAMLAHELRNPLAPVQSAVQLLRKHCPMDPDTQWAHDVIERQVLHMKRMVDDLLDVSRITRGMINLQKEVVDLATITNRAVEMIQPQIDARKHHLTITLPAQAVFLEADPPRLAQALANLFDNAAKYTNEGGEISLIAERQGNDILLRVRDNGSGIPLDYLPHVFDLFSQEDRSLERTRGGLGIGLTLVRTLIHMHGGAIEAFSAGTGQGSEFVVRLPALPESPSRPLPASTVESTGAVGSTPRRILVVDDNVDGARSLSILLRQMGHEVQTAFDGLAAVEMARKNPPEVVLLDIGMPQMNGLQVARCIRGELGLMNTLLVAMTGYGQDEDRHRSQEAGFNAHMVKPLDLDALAELLARPLIDLGVPDKA